MSNSAPFQVAEAEPEEEQLRVARLLLAMSVRSRWTAAAPPVQARSATPAKALPPSSEVDYDDIDFADPTLPPVAHHQHLRQLLYLVWVTLTDWAFFPLLAAAYLAFDAALTAAVVVRVPCECR